MKLFSTHKTRAIYKRMPSKKTRLTQVKKSHRVIALFLALNFFQTLLPYDLIYANNNGPKAPEAGGFEPVDASDMISLLTGDVNYILPLMDVPSPEGGYPLVLAYHAGIAYDQDATWAGLGWNINPGVIDRSVNGHPDDWKAASIRDRNYYNFESTTINVGLGVGGKVALEVGVGYTWDSNGGHGGSVSLAAVKGNVSASVGVGFHTTNGWSANAGVSYQKGISRVGLNVDSNSGVSGSASLKSGDNSLGISIGSSGFSVSGNLNGVGKVGYTSNNSTSGDSTSQSANIKFPIYPGVYLKFGYTKVKYEKDELYHNSVWGPIHFKDFGENLNVADDITYSNGVSTEVNRDYYMDVYDQPIPQVEKEFISFKDTFEKFQNAFTNPAYDSYVVNAQGVSGTMRPRLFENGYLVGKGYKNEYETTPENPIHALSVIDDIALAAIEDNNPELLAFGVAQSGSLSQYIQDAVLTFYEQYAKRSAVVNYNYNSSGKFDKVLGNNNTDLQFYFDNSFHSNLEITQNTINNGAPSNASNVNQFFTGAHENNTSRPENGSYIETFTNGQINDMIANGNYFLESKDFVRTEQDGALIDGIGGYRVTTPDGKTYHYSQPVYQYEEVYRQLTPRSDQSQPDVFSEDQFYREQRKIQPYATHWMLTAITGPDFVKMSDEPYPTNEDYGYWTRFDYGSWTDGYVWRNPPKKDTYNNLTFDRTKRVDEYSWGRKQLVYLNKVVTRSHQALFVKSVREDNEGSQIGMPGPGGFPSYEGDGNVYYSKQKSLKVDEIILVNTEDGNINLNNTQGNLISSPGVIKTATWSSMDPISYRTNLQNNVLDNKDLEINPTTGKYVIYDKALKVVKLDHDYSLAVNAETGQGKLTLNGVRFLGRKAYDYMPPYEFDYKNRDADYQYCYDYDTCNKDPWGFNKIDPETWSLEEISTPLGSKIVIDYEKDSYHTEAFARRYWSEGLVFKVTEYSDTEYKINITNSNEFVEDAHVRFDDYFEVGEDVLLDLWIARRRNRRRWTGGVSRKSAVFDLRPREITNDDFLPEVLSATATSLDILVNRDVGYGPLIYNPCPGGLERGLIHGQSFCQANSCSVTHVYDAGDDRGECPAYVPPPGGPDRHSDHHNMYYNIISNRTPVGDMGGGLRAKAIETHSATGEITKLAYDYDDPIKNRTSGITSYAPVRGYKYVAYQAEVPGPRVMYEYVTVSEVGQNNESLGYTTYKFDVLKPMEDIFQSNIQLGNHFKATVTERSLPKETQGVDVKIEDNTVMMGSLLSVSEYNKVGHLMNMRRNSYEPFENLANTNRGSIQESFRSMRSIYDLDARYVKLPFDYGIDISDLGTPFAIGVSFNKNLFLESNSSLDLIRRNANVSTKISYPLIKNHEEIVNAGYTTRTTYLNPDLKTGDYLSTITTKPDGAFIKSDKLPAYLVYPEMGSKVDDPSNKHMLSQEAMMTTSISQDGNTYKTVDASISTWNNRWGYRSPEGIVSNPDSEVDVWRKHKTFVWKDAVDPDGAFVENITIDEAQFEWGTGEPLDPKWQNTSEITRYNHYSQPLETGDINNNFAASKMSADETKVLISGNAKQVEMFFSSAERPLSSTRFEGGVYGANFVTDEIVHAGEYSVMANAANDRVFEIKNVSAVDRNNMRSGKYKISYWHTKQENSENNVLVYNGDTIDATESVEAGCWILKNHYVDYVSGQPFNLYVTNKLEGGHYFDDFRVHPIASSVNSYIYNEKTDELNFILDGMNLTAAFKYDNAGRMVKTYAEVPSGDNFVGGIKVQSKNRYKYAGTIPASIDIHPDNINWYGCLDDVPVDDNPCPQIGNPDYPDTDGDGLPDICDTDDDNDGISDEDDNCPNNPNNDQTDTDGDGEGDACDDDDDGDGILDEDDNCPLVPNSDQTDTDGDGIGDACDDTPLGDDDDDGIPNPDDNCIQIYNPDQSDVDGDGIGDVCDNCITTNNPNQEDQDADLVGDVCDNCPNEANHFQIDSDNDGIGDQCDPVDDCDPDSPNFIDSDGDGIADLCDPCPDNPNEGCDDDGTGDIDDDGILDGDDNCQYVPNPDQSDIDGDIVGDVCDNCPRVYNPEQEDTDGDGIGDACEKDCSKDPDSDKDGIRDGCDNCPKVYNPNQADSNGNGIGDVCEPKCERDGDQDRDGIKDGCDNCPEVYNPNQADSNGNGIGDVCDLSCERDGDKDRDGIRDGCDNCPTIYNPGQEDVNGNGIGDVCENIRP